MASYTALLNQYRVLPPQPWRISNILAYSLGLFLLVAPFIKSLASLMAVVTIAYFILVFVTLGMRDLVSLAFKRSTELCQLMDGIYKFKLRRIRFAFDTQFLFWSLRKNFFAFLKALPL